jgi:hypothetical protein
MNICYNHGLKDVNSSQDLEFGLRLRHLQDRVDEKRRDQHFDPLVEFLVQGYLGIMTAQEAKRMVSEILRDQMEIHLAFRMRNPPVRQSRSEHNHPSLIARIYNGV